MRVNHVFHIIFLAATTAFFGCSRTGNVKVIKLAHGLDVSHPVHKGMQFMAERLAEKSNNSLQIKIYPSQQLGTERQCVELLQIGSLGMTKVSSGVLENFAPSMKIFGLPFLFEDKQHGYRVLDGEIGKQLLDESAKYWLKGIAFYDAGYRSFYTKDRSVSHPDDLKGLKIRVMESVSAMNMVRSLGGSPTPISWGELYTSLQQGIVDGAENNPPSFYLSHHYEVCKNYILDEHSYLPDVLIMSTIVWESLDTQQQKWLMEAAQESVIYQRKIWAEAEEHALAEVKKAGVRVSYPDKRPFREFVSSIYEAYGKNETFNTMIKKINDLKSPKTDSTLVTNLVEDN